MTLKQVMDAHGPEFGKGLSALQNTRLACVSSISKWTSSSEECPTQRVRRVKDSVHFFRLKMNNRSFKFQITVSKLGVQVMTVQQLKKSCLPTGLTWGERR